MSLYFLNIISFSLKFTFIVGHDLTVCFSFSCFDVSGDWIASNVDDIRDDDALEVYGHEDTSTVQLASYNFEVT